MEKKLETAKEKRAIRNKRYYDKCKRERQDDTKLQKAEEKRAIRNRKYYDKCKKQYYDETQHFKTEIQTENNKLKRKNTEEPSVDDNIQRKKRKLRNINYYQNSLSVKKKFSH